MPEMRFVGCVNGGFLYFMRCGDADSDSDSLFYRRCTVHLLQQYRSGRNEILHFLRQTDEYHKSAFSV